MSEVLEVIHSFNGIPLDVSTPSLCTRTSSTEHVTKSGRIGTKNKNRLKY